MKEIGRAMKDSVPTEEDKLAFRELFGKSGAQMIESVRALGTMGPIKLIDSKTVTDLYNTKKAVDELKLSYDRAAAPKIGLLANATKSVLDFFNRGGSHLDEDEKKIRDEYKKRNDERGKELIESLIISRQ